MAASRFRLQFKFWLDMNKSDEYELAGLIEELKQAGSFTKAVRQGLRLVVDLWQGRVDVLLALFPWVEDYFFERFSQQQPVADRALTAQLVKLEQLLLDQGNKPISPRVGGNPQPLLPGHTVQPVAAAESADLDTPLPIKKAVSAGESAKNFLDSAFSLIG